MPDRRDAERGIPAENQTCDVTAQALVICAYGVVPREVPMTPVRRHHAGPDRRVPFISVARIRELIDSAANAHASIVSFQTRARCGHWWRAFFCGRRIAGKRKRPLVARRPRRYRSVAAVSGETASASVDAEAVGGPHKKGAHRGWRCAPSLGLGRRAPWKSARPS